jgi:DNA-binding transcriptional LysR family regulator
MLSVHKQHLVASPILLARQAQPRAPQELSTWPSLWLGSPEQQFVWHLQHAEEKAISIAHQPRLITTDMVALRGAALAGLGVVQLPMIMIHEQIAAGTLVRVLPEWGPREEAVHAVFASRRGMLPAVRALIDHLAVEFAKVEC